VPREWPGRGTTAGRRAADFIVLLRMLTEAFPRPPVIVVICDNDSIEVGLAGGAGECGLTDVVLVAEGEEIVAQLVGDDLRRSPRVKAATSPRVQPPSVPELTRTIPSWPQARSGARC
jgi:hypothetical protein